MKSQQTDKKTWLGVVIGFALLLVTTNARTALAQQWATNGNHIYNTNSGNVGIGTSTPGRLLHILDTTNSPVFSGARVSTILDCSDPVLEFLHQTANKGFRWRLGACDLSNFYLDYSGSGFSTFSPYLTVLSTGNVGIGTSTPSYKLDVAGTVNATGVSVNGSPITGSQWTTNGTNINYATGNVGIGTSTPTTKLHVVGDVTVTGNIAAKYQDVAEWVPAAEQIPAGTVVVLDPTKSNQVTSSTEAYDIRVAGVISEQPGIALGESGKNKVLVATTGRVRVKVDATRGPIRIGDLLVTSEKPGLAMKSEPVNLGGVLIHRPGTLIGKALEPLAKGKGTILVLLSLQ